MIELLQLGQRFGYDELTAALQQAQTLGMANAAVVRYLLTAATQPATAAPLLPAEAWSGEHYRRPLRTSDIIESPFAAVAYGQTRPNAFGQSNPEST
jgi:hypothetical protein